MCKVFLIWTIGLPFLLKNTKPGRRNSPSTQAIRPLRYLFLQSKTLTRIWWVPGSKLRHSGGSERTHKCIVHPHPDSFPAFRINKCQVRQPYGMQRLPTSVNHCEKTQGFFFGFKNMANCRLVWGVGNGWEGKPAGIHYGIMHAQLVFWCNKTCSNCSNAGELRLYRWQPRWTDNKPNWLMTRHQCLCLTD